MIWPSYSSARESAPLRDALMVISDTGFVTEIDSWETSLRLRKNRIDELVAPRLLEQLNSTEMAYRQFKTALQKARMTQPNADDVLNHYDQVITNWILWWHRPPLVPDKLYKYPATISCNSAVVRCVMHFPGDGENKVYLEYTETANIFFVFMNGKWLIEAVDFRVEDTTGPRSVTLEQRLAEMKNLFSKHAEQWAQSHKSPRDNPGG